MSSEPKKVGRRTFLNYAIAVVATGVIVGAATYLAVPKEVTTVTAPGATTTVTAPGTTTIKTVTTTVSEGKKLSPSLYCYMHSVHKTAIGDLTKLFKFIYGTEITIDTNTQPYLQNKIITEASLPTGTIDIGALTEMDFTPLNVPLLEPLNDYIKVAPIENYDDIIPSLLTMCNKGGVQYGIPIRTGTHIIYYRKDLFEKNGISPPKNIEDIYEIGKQFKGTGIYGLNMIGAKTRIFHYFPNFMWAFGGEYFSEDLKEVLIDRDETVAALEFLKKLYDDGILPPKFLTIDQDEETTIWQQGMAAMSISYTGRLVPFTDPKSSKVSKEMTGYLVIPAAKGREGKNHVYGGEWSAVIPKNSQKKDTAWEFIRFISHPVCTLLMALNGNDPVRVSTYNESRLKEQRPAEFLKVFNESNKIAKPALPAIANVEKIQDIIATEIHNALMGQKSARDALKDAKKAIEPLLA